MVDPVCKQSMAYNHLKAKALGYYMGMSVQRALQRADSTNQLQCWSHEGSCIHVTYVQYVMHLFIHIHVYICTYYVYI